MNKENFIWEKDGFNKNPYSVPDGYFAGFADRMMEQLMDPEVAAVRDKRRLIRPWMAWVSGIAAVLLVGWFGMQTLFVKPVNEASIQENIALMVDYYGEELHEGDLAGYFEDNKIDYKGQASIEVNALIQFEPNLAEEYIFESVGF